MYDHQIKRYSLVEQRAVYRWFVFSSVVIIISVIVLSIMIFIWEEKSISASVHYENEIKSLEEKIKNGHMLRDFLDQVKLHNQKQLDILEQLALCIPDQVCLNEARINSKQVQVTGVSYTYNAIFEYQKALESCLHHSFIIKSIDKQSELITFVLETTGEH